MQNPNMVRMFRCQRCKDFSSPRKADTLKHERHCGGRRKEKGRIHGEGDEERREGGTENWVAILRSPRQGGQVEIGRGKPPRVLNKGTRKKACLRPPNNAEGKRAGKPPTAVIHPTPPRAQRRLKWPSLQQLLDLGSPLEERTFYVRREGDCKSRKG
ncbi:hypothetical protein HOLleu_32578 [Holothuria leucospilota]|uniref:Uncharacterized protein n=1 Tax=Holothuria leucospilota TaxID=206669 RepID=A0A9Q1GXC5_HOLLE|nr:hypothetical protein HOLleu_32578 [Holothuria leucospilota]